MCQQRPRFGSKARLELFPFAWVTFLWVSFRTVSAAMSARPSKIVERVKTALRAKSTQFKNWSQNVTHERRFAGVLALPSNFWITA
jgi:hypothetical protein